MVGNYFLSLTKLSASLTWKKFIKTTIITKLYIRSSAQQILRTVVESFRSYYGLIIAYSEEKISDRPRIPNYRKKGGMATVSYPKQALKLKDNQIRVPRL
ncbi:hypothetical protein [Okeania sp. KiyG1]|uniref:hypothetical protein n=1 Tax=Okeania sp. KiyG1 TaxID=2720165 RepID=UPI001988F505|nr:hypothetical protein [Okeania sp. KiyG1]GGA37128.1 hypothetical protein CYANOKiyG1_55090 [Okeania sp. KiyG1]